MAKNVKNLDNMTKHLTKKEREEREEASEKLKRAKVKLVAPDRVKRNPEAQAYWKKYVKMLKGMEVLDDVDADVLGRLCLMHARADRLQETIEEKDEMPLDLISRIESTERNILAYAQKLGLTPESRARLAKKIAEKPAEDPDADLFD